MSRVVRLPAIDHHNRRAFLGMMSVGLAVAITGCSSDDTTNSVNPAPNGVPPATDTSANAIPVATRPLPPIPPPHPGPSVKVDHAPIAGHKIVLTVDDGDNADVVAGYVDFVRRTGIHLTFSPNGTYAHSWAPHADIIKPLVANQQVQVMNHTFSHLDLRKMTDAKITEELERNDEWVQQHFGITTRPYYRPPFGFHNAHIDGVVSGLGYTRTVMWNGSYSDSEIITPQYLMQMAQKYLQPGVILLGHANHPTVLGLFDQLTALIKQRDLTPVTLDEMFGTSRAIG
jgi:peptidoglycan/xylan/chitin deacetylase (PgdA/CDA1 family)